jgi:branched-chain amino acid transport system ATP-binding protein
MSSPILELQGIDASYGRIQVLRGVDLSVPVGAVVALLGPNGAGKSTTLKVAAGLLEPDAGHVHIAGTHVNGASPDELSRKGVCTVPEGRSVFPNLTVRENLALSAFSCDRSVSELHAIAYERFPRLGERRDQLAGHLSGGEQQMLAMARALATDPALLLLDELSMGLAPLIVEELYDVVGQLAREGMSVLLVEQFARTAMRVADYAAVMTNGRIMAVGEPQDIEQELSAAYLGGAA